MYYIELYRETTRRPIPTHSDPISYIWRPNPTHSDPAPTRSMYLEQQGITAKVGLGRRTNVI